MEYDHRRIEARWQAYWRENNVFRTASRPGRKYYALEMFAYPSGDLHLGHCKNYVIGDIYARFKRRTGHDVLHPFGWDAFGLPAENRAIKMGIHPEISTTENINLSRESLQRLGISYDWEREIITCMPDYYCWTQWMFLLLFKRNLAYKKEAYVNWCPSCQTVLANEQVIDDHCYRCDTAVVKRKLNQWFFKITEYADRLSSDLDTLPGWPDNIKTIQKNWIGRSQGCNVIFKVAGRELSFDVFTTRPDTIYGVTFMSIAPEHAMIEELISGYPGADSVRAYVRDSTKRTAVERAEKEKDGVFTGSYAVNPVNGEKIPIYVADYVLFEYGSGVVMGVPAHDQRDFQFARKYGIPIRIVIQPTGQTLAPASMTQAYEDHGVMVNSGPFNGMDSIRGIAAVIEHIAANAGGGPAVNYRIRDWLISRQRFWGAPIPIIYCDQCGMQPVPEKDLPVMLPRDIKDFVPKGKSPLAGVDSFINAVCPSCGAPAQRDPDTMDTFVCSSWYFLRYLDPRNESCFCGKDKSDQWLPIDMYIGGTSEHATGHLIYFRFFTKVLYDAGLIAVNEPAQNLFNLGMLMKDGEKMSSSRGNLVPVRQFIDDHGADVARITIVTAAPPERESEWTQEGVIGSERLLSRIYRLITEHREKIVKVKPAVESAEDEKLMIKINQTIHKVGADLDAFKFNTAIAALWELLNELYTAPVKSEVFGYGLFVLVDLLSPFAPHLADELHAIAGADGSLTNIPWPGSDPKYLRGRTITIVIQVNGKVRSRLEIDGSFTEKQVVDRALKDDKISRYVQKGKIQKTVYVPEKLLNIVI